MTGAERDVQRVNVRQIAEIAGVSTATVSRVYRGVGQVSPAMRERVSRAIAEHGYRPSPLGTALANRRNGTLGIVFPGLSGPYFGELIEGFDDAARAANLNVTVFGRHVLEDEATELTAMVERVDGLAVHAGVVDDAILSQLAELVPLVLIGGDPSGRGVPTTAVRVRSDHAHMRELVDHLIHDHNRHRLLFVGRPDASPDTRSRHDQYRAALRSAHLPVTAPLDTWLTQSDGVRAAPEVLRRLRSGTIDAAVCANDELALGLLFALLGHGVAVGHDLSITGVDDVPISALVTPSLTTLARPLRTLASRAATLLLDRLSGAPATSEVVPSTVILRTSCGCADTTH